MSCSVCSNIWDYQKTSLSGLTPSTYGAIATSQYDSGIKINWQRILESAITGVLVAVISTYLLKALKE